MSSSATTANKNLIDVTIQDVFEAETRIRPFILQTPLLSKTALTKMSGWEKGLYFKCEALQRTGSFKIRGCQNAVRKVLEQQQQQGDSKTASEPLTFVCHSSGNAGQALSKAAIENGSKAHIVVPRTAPSSKVAAMKEYGAKVLFCEPNQKAREASVKALLDVEYAGKKAVFVHPYDNKNIIAGQGTVGLEIASQFPAALQEKNPQDPFLLQGNASAESSPATVPVFISPVGGGGLTSGLAIALRFKFPNAIIIGAEPKNVDDASRSFQTGRVEQNNTASPSSAPATTIADGLMTTLSPRTFAILRENLDGIVTVTEEEIARATKEIFQRLKVVIEPSAGVSAAVALYKRDEIVRRFGGKVSGGEASLNAAVCVLCGGNVDIVSLGKIFAKL